MELYVDELRQNIQETLKWLCLQFVSKIWPYVLVIGYLTLLMRGPLYLFTHAVQQQIRYLCLRRTNEYYTQNHFNQFCISGNVCVVDEGYPPVIYLFALPANKCL